MPTFTQLRALKAEQTVPAPIADARVITNDREAERLVRDEIRLNEAAAAATTAHVESQHQAEYEPPQTLDDSMVESKSKLSRLIDHNFPFDESQLEAIAGLASEPYACMTGAAGTGKTTTLKAVVDSIQDSIGAVDMTTYFKRGVDQPGVDEDDDYEITESWVPSICLVGFTGRSSQMIKKNFPRDWHGNIMTIHRMLAFAPEFYERWDEDTQQLKNSMRFIPTYNSYFKMPWDVIVIDEAGMVSIDLWHQVLDAMKDGCRVIMVGDINQLPPVHGRSVFGFALSEWPSWELTHIHRQVGQNNAIVDNAWNILRGVRPKSDDYKNDPTWKFAMMPISEESAIASQQIRKFLQVSNGKAYQPNRDSVITAINGDKGTERGYALGQVPMNRELAIVLNAGSARILIDAGRERKQFAVGDKVMATRNDHEAGITNGMTGIITSIERNGAYAGDYMRFGEISEVSKYINSIDTDDEEEFSLEELHESMDEINEGIKAGKESRDRGPASHIVTVRFGEKEHAFELAFSTLAEVASLMTAYVVTCHKMQGGESPLVIVICHQSHKSMLYREWLYTAVTRASAKCVLFYTDQGLRVALNKQRITGKTLAEKVQVFKELSTKGVAGAAVNVRLPKSESSARTMLVKAADRVDPMQLPANRVNPLQRILDEQKAKTAERVAQAQPEPAVSRVEQHTHFHVHVASTTTVAESPASAKDYGELQRADPVFRATTKELNRIFNKLARPRAVVLPSPVPAKVDVVPVSQVFTHHQAARPEPLRLTYQPAPKPAGKFRFGGK